MVVTREAERYECIFVEQGWHYVSNSVGNTAVVIQEQDQGFSALKNKDLTKQLR